MSMPWSGELCSIVRHAGELAERMGTKPSTLHLLQALAEEQGDAQVFLATQGLNGLVVAQHVALGSGDSDGDVQRVYERSRRVAASARQDTVTPLHLLLALAQETTTDAGNVIRHSGVDLEAVRTMTYSVALSPSFAHRSGVSRRRGERTVDSAATRTHALNHGTRQIGLHPALAERAARLTVDDSQEPERIKVERLSSECVTLDDAELETLDGPILSPTAFARERTRVGFGTTDPEEASALIATQQLLAFPELGLDELPHQQPRPSHESAHGRVKTEPGLPRPSAKTGAGLDSKKPPRRPRRKTARESAEHTARTLAARLFPVDKPEAPADRPAPTLPRPTPILSKPAPILSKSAPIIQSAPRVIGLSGQRGVGAGHTAGPPRKSPIIRRSPAGAPAGFDRFDLNAKTFPILAKFGRNLLAEARQGKLDPVIGREEEIEHLIDVINKRRSNNPVLVGSAGVGKTAIVEGLARLMAEDDPPPGLDERTVIALDLGTLLCGTQLRGSLQERLIGIKKEVKKAKGRILLFLDELHTWLSGGGEGSEASGELKMALARGELPCIGATTPDEFKRAIESDPAFERRFELIDVKPPSVEDAITIIQGIIDRYAAHHSVQYAPEIVENAVKLSERYIRERTLPDKAISILDRAGSVARRSGANAVSREHIAEVVSNRTGVCHARLLMRDNERMLCMEDHLADNLVGHSSVVERIARVIRRNHAGFGSKRPIGSFLFLGPTGVGKTETVKVLADFLFGSRDAIVRFDMSEFMEQHAVARLLGAPPGYVGFEDGGQLTEALRRHPYQIVLLDEIEKAHPDVLNVLLQLLDEGRLTDGRGRTVDFSNTVVIMTSNLGGEILSGGTRKGIGFAAHEEPETVRGRLQGQVLEVACRAFPPELWNRIEERLVFHPLERSDVAQIAALQLRDSAKRLRSERGIDLEFAPMLQDFLVDNGGFDPAYGARPMRKAVQRLVEGAIADTILRGELLPGGAAYVTVEDGQIVVDVLVVGGLGTRSGTFTSAVH